MKNMKKSLLVCVSLALIAVIAIGGTVAYVTTGKQTKGNVFSIGDVVVNLDEDTAVIGEGGTVTETEDGATYNGVMPGDYLKKEVTVSNDGSKAAYVAVSVTLNNANIINKAIDVVYEKKGYTAEQVQAMYDYVFDGWGINYNPRPGATGKKDARGVIDGAYGLPEHVLKVDFSKTTKKKDTFMFGIDNWFKSETEIAATSKNAYSTHPLNSGYYTADMGEYEINYTYYIYLEAGESTTLFNGLRVPAEFNADQLKMFDGLTIDIEAQAIQADNFYGEAKAAFTVLKAGEAYDASPVVVDTDEEFKAAVTGDSTIITVELDADVTYKIGPWEKYAMGGTDTRLIIVNGNGHTLSFYGTDSDWNHVVTNGATLVLNNVNITNSGHNDGPWNRYDINFACDVVLDNVNSDKALAFKANADLNDVTVTETGDVYAVWVQANGQTVDIDGLTVTSGRGIKIDEQYVDAPAKVTLNVSNAEFNTTKKAAILVKSAAGADINLSNVDISNVAVDYVNEVWVDSDAAATADKVNVVGGSKVVEGTVTVSTAKTVEDLKNAVTAANNDGKVAAILLTDNITLNERIVPSKGLVIDGGNNTISANTGDLLIYNQNGGALTIKDVSIEGKAQYAVYTVGANVNFTNVTIKMDGNRPLCLYGGGNVTMTDCNITGDPGNDKYSSANIWVGNGYTVTINGGEYGSIFVNANENVFNNVGYMWAGTIIVNDGTIDKLILETEIGKTDANKGTYVSAELVQNGGTINNLVENPQNYDLSGLTKYN